MTAQIKMLEKLASVRATKVRQIQSQVNYQQGLCQRYRNNIKGLETLCQFNPQVETPLQRSNQQQYKTTLFKMLELQRRELATAEQTLTHIQRDLLQAMRDEKVLCHLIDSKWALWQDELTRQAQKIQDGLAAQSWWRQQMG